MEGGRIFNFSAGPSMLPIEVLKLAQSEVINYQGSGMSVMEMSHRSKEFCAIWNNARNKIKSLLKVPENYYIFLLQGGGTLEFAAIPLNILGEKTKANYLITGEWSKKAAADAKKYCQVVEVWKDHKEDKFVTVPDKSTWNVDKTAGYFYYTSNETIHGVEQFDFPYEMAEGMPLVCDMSSDFMSRPVDVSKYGIIYAGAQKNLGPAGTTVIIIRKDLVGKKCKAHPCPSVIDFELIAKDGENMYNTPASYSNYICSLVLNHMDKMGGIDYYNKFADEKSKLVYNMIDSSNGYYLNNIDPKYRSRMNLVFRIKNDPKLEDKFVEEAKKEGMIELKGHRSVGGMRASLYNAMPMEGVTKLVAFMKKFMEENK